MKLIGETMPSPDEFKKYWNDQEELKHCLKMSKERITKLKLRCKDPDFVQNWEMAVSKMAQMPFYCGEKGWRADATYFLRNDDNWVRILEEGMPLNCFRCGGMRGLKRNRHTGLMYCKDSKDGPNGENMCHLAAKTRGREGMQEAIEVG